MRKFSFFFFNIEIATELGKDKIFDNKGFSLVEVIVVCTVIGILVAVAVPSFMGHIEQARKVVCDTNNAQLEKMYGKYLILENANHLEGIFVQYLQDYGRDTCSDDGDIDYWDGKVRCTVHSRDIVPRSDQEDQDEDEGGSVPIL